MGVHLSKVRSANLDTWLPNQVAFAAIMGNGRAAVFWEARLPSDFSRPRDGDMRALSVFINNKCGQCMNRKTLAAVQMRRVVWHAAITLAEYCMRKHKSTTGFLAYLGALLDRLTAVHRMLSARLTQCDDLCAC